jgi:hypothetical protein
MTTSGYIVVGVDDHGELAGDVAHLELFDPAALHDKLVKSRPNPFGIRSAVHRYGGQSYALL